MCGCAYVTDQLGEMLISLVKAENKLLESDLPSGK